MTLRIGVLALQGAYALHKAHIEACGAVYEEVRDNEPLQRCDALILPGGESSTMLKLIEHKELWDPLHNYLQEKPSWGICAGAILLAQTITSHDQRSFATIPISICRNGYGRQIHSQEDMIEGYEVSWIRAPKIQEVSKNAAVLHTTKQGHKVWVETPQSMATTFHPELNRSTPSPWHVRFIERAKIQHTTL